MSYFTLEGCSDAQSAGMYADALRIGLRALPPATAEVYRSIDISVCVGDEWCTKEFTEAFKSSFKEVPGELHDDLETFSHLF